MIRVTVTYSDCTSETLQQVFSNRRDAAESMRRKGHILFAEVEPLIRDGGLTCSLPPGRRTVAVIELSES